MRCIRGFTFFFLIHAMVRANKPAKRFRITKQVRRKWSAREKLIVIYYYYRHHSIRETASRFDIEPKQVRDWIRKKDKLMKASPFVEKLHPGRKAKYPEIEEELASWIKDNRDKSRPITRPMIVRKAKLLAEKDIYQEMYPDVSTGKFSNKWVDAFMSRFSLSTRRRTTVAQNLPEDLVEKQQQFLSFILFRRREHNYPLKYIANLDETSVTFDLPSTTTVDKRGTKTVSIRTTGHERSCFTVMLCCLADGTKLPATCIFKLRTMPRGEFPAGINVRVNAKGWCNEVEMLWWINNVWSTRLINGNETSRSLLVLDSFRGHLVDSVKQQFISKKTDLAVIPGGLTSKLQPLDVMINHSFKSKVLYG